MADTRLSLVVGLGNPGARYAGTRHNLGFEFLDRLAERDGLSWRHREKHAGWLARLGAGPWLLKPDTWVNNSGEAVRRVASWLRVEPVDILVVHDELDFPPGVARLKKGGGHGCHNGLRDIIAKIGSAGFWRLRLGIGHPGDPDRVSGYVLSKPPETERELLSDSIQRLLDVFPDLIAQGPLAVQQSVNRRAEDAQTPAPDAADKGPGGG